MWRHRSILADHAHADVPLGVMLTLEADTDTFSGWTTRVRVGADLTLLSFTATAEAPARGTCPPRKATSDAVNLVVAPEQPT